MWPALAACRLTAPDPYEASAGRLILEAESAAVDDARVVPGLLASGRAVVAFENAARLAVDVTWPGPGQPDLPDAAVPACLWVRASCLGDGALQVWCDGANVATWRLSDTWHRDRFEWDSLALGALAVGSHRMELVHEAGALWLDQVAVWPQGRALPAARSPAVYRAPGLEIRAAADAQVFDVEWVFYLMRRHRAFVAQALGFDLQRTAVLAVLDDAHWPDPGTGAFQSGGVVYLKESELHLSWVNYTHEFVHVFQSESAAATPRFFTEGVAFLVAQLGELRLYERTDAVARRIARLKRSTSDPLPPGVLFEWGETSPEPAPVRALYQQANALLWQIYEQQGAAWLSPLYAELRDPTAPRTRALQSATTAQDRARALLASLSAAVGRDLTPLFEAHGLVAAEAQP